ncbi:hypothetical protein D210916BOD24_32320 [Alteromonas sp. D210916BOD_24]|uniref:class I SAM-dependent methyltransferase n=1 Tax=Alteromonas sp. D210916BOD_24 TaxID=3157618 RepID=UPI00399C56F8
MDINLNFYQRNKDSLIKQYDSVSFESVHKDWLEYIPSKGAVLDIGAGSGRDARYLSSLGLKVFAAEPVLSLLISARENSVDHDIIWFQDKLPALYEAKTLGTKFELILLSAVWMHLSPEERILSMQNMSSLINAGGKLVITLRYGEFSDGRSAFPISVDEVKKLADANGLNPLLETELNPDQLGRGKVVWQTVVLGKK